MVSRTIRCLLPLLFVLTTTGCSGGDGGASAQAAGTPSSSASPPVTTPAAPALTAPTTAGAEIGAYYFPGWHVEPLLGSKDPWAEIRPYPDRKPSLGYYDDQSRTVIRQQAD